MEGQYEIQLEGKRVGHTKVQRQGLYYLLRCRCQPPQQGLYRISLSCGRKHTDLGICVPVEQGIGLDTRIPVKQLGEGEPCFTLCAGKAPSQERFIPVQEDQPFEALDRLRGARLSIRDGIPGIVIREN